MAVIAGSFATPAYCQNRFMDEAKESADRRAQNKAVREAENPEPATNNTKTVANPAAQPAPGETAPAQAASSAAAAPAR
jgi:hypothetical protein